MCWAYASPRPLAPAVQRPMLLRCRILGFRVWGLKTPKHLSWVPDRGCAVRAQDSVVSADPYTGTNDVVASGSYISSVLGVRLSTPLFGTGFNTCIGARAAPATRLVQSGSS